MPISASIRVQPREQNDDAGRRDGNAGVGRSVVYSQRVTIVGDLMQQSNPLADPLAK